MSTEESKDPRIIDNQDMDDDQGINDAKTDENDYDMTIENKIEQLLIRGWIMLPESCSIECIIFI